MHIQFYWYDRDDLPGGLEIQITNSFEIIKPTDRDDAHHWLGRMLAAITMYVLGTCRSSIPNVHKVLSDLRTARSRYHYGSNYQISLYIEWPLSLQEAVNIAKDLEAFLPQALLTDDIKVFAGKRVRQGLTRAVSPLNSGNNPPPGSTPGRDPI